MEENVKTIILRDAEKSPAALKSFLSKVTFAVSFSRRSC